MSEVPLSPPLLNAQTPSAASRGIRGRTVVDAVHLVDAASKISDFGYNRISGFGYNRVSGIYRIDAYKPLYFTQL